MTSHPTRRPTRPVVSGWRIKLPLLLGLLGLLGSLGPADLGGPFAVAPAHALPGQAWVALQPASVPGDFDVDAYLLIPEGFTAHAADHPDGWALAYRHASPPVGWTRPFLIRGGGPAQLAGALHPHFAGALEQMLPARLAALVTLRDTPDSTACFPGKPNPAPLLRDGWLFLHDGSIDITAINEGLWLADAGPAWEAFKSAHPRDYNGNEDPARGNASEVYFLALLYQLSQSPDDVWAAFRRTLLWLEPLPGWEGWQLNAVLQGPSGTYVLRYALGAPEDYRLFYTRTTQGEYCIADLAPDPESWVELPNLCLTTFPEDGAPFTLPVALSALPDPPPGDDPGPGDPDPPHAPDHTWPSLHFSRSPARGVVRLGYTLPAGTPGTLTIWDLEGRRRAHFSLTERSGAIRWAPDPGLRSGLLLARLTTAGHICTGRVLFLR